MAATTAEPSPTRRTPPPRTVRLLRLGAAAILLLALSETLWLWQTWPVRQLLQPPAPATPEASGR